MKKFIICVMFVFIVGCGKPYIPVFEGDCVDRAVNIRQTLKKQGYEAKLMIGYDGDGHGHCWIEYKDKKTGEWITFKNYTRMTWH